MFATPPIEVGTKQWYTVPLSILAHAIALGTLIVIPLMATGALPTPQSILAFAVTPPAPPPPPGPPPKPETQAAAPAENTVPVEAPPTIPPATPPPPSLTLAVPGGLPNGPWLLGSTPTA